MPFDCLHRPSANELSHDDTGFLEDKPSVDKNKATGYIVTFQSPGRCKVHIDQAIELFSNGGTCDIFAPPFTEAEGNFHEAILKLRILAPSPGDCVAYGPDVRKKTEFCIAYYWWAPAGLRSRLNVWIPNVNNSWKIAMWCNVFLSLKNSYLHSVAKSRMTI